jgi:hypothetical protein
MLTSVARAWAGPFRRNPSCCIHNIVSWLIAIALENRVDSIRLLLSQPFSPRTTPTCQTGRDDFRIFRRPTTADWQSTVRLSTEHGSRIVNRTKSHGITCDNACVSGQSAAACQVRGEEKNWTPAAVSAVSTTTATDVPAATGSGTQAMRPLG